jgi:hypothetical protein
VLMGFGVERLPCVRKLKVKELDKTYLNNGWLITLFSNNYKVLLCIILLLFSTIECFLGNEWNRCCFCWFIFFMKHFWGVLPIFLNATFLEVMAPLQNVFMDILNNREIVKFHNWSWTFITLTNKWLCIFTTINFKHLLVVFNKNAILSIW